MSDRLTRIELDCETGQETIIELTDQEISDLELASTIAEEERLRRESAAEALAALKASAKAKLIAGQPLTAEEADTLVI